MRQDRPMNTEGVAALLFKVVKPQPTIEQVRVWARHHLIKGEDMLYSAGLTDELGNWLPMPKPKT